MAAFSFPEQEQKILSFWKDEQIFQKSLTKTKEGPIYNFYDGPPFATGLPHHGHLLASTIKDIVGRYFTMHGYHVERRFGWDCHGVPIEHQIDKKYGMSTQEAVATYGVEGYNQACRDIVDHFVDAWESTIHRLGRWVDFENDYKTMDKDFMESVWWVFKSLWEKDRIYQGTKVVPYSTALQTVLSNFEAGSNYQTVQDPSIMVLFEMQNKPWHLAVWTTTPWTLPSNLGVCVGASIDYVVYQDEHERLIVMSKSCYLQKVDTDKHPILQNITGASLVSEPYQPLFPYFESYRAQGAFQVVHDDFVSIEEGTGLVHMAPAFGEEDHRIMQEVGIQSPPCPLDAEGCLTEEVIDFKGLYIKDADPLIIRALKERGLLYHQATIDHAYPMCPRSDTPLIYRLIPSWYVKVSDMRERLLAANEQIHWVPAHIKKGRFGRWLENARDWAISRNRVWGTPLPLWINDETGKIHCIGSVEELETLSGQVVKDLHRDHVDDVTFSLPDEKGVYRRVPEVLDCWFESGSMPYAQKHFPFEQQDVFKQCFPAKFISEGVDQTRAWFYTLLVLSVSLFDSPPFENVIVSGIVLAEDGKKMSKRLKNYTAPDALMDEYGADALRLYLIHSGLVKAEEQRFCDAGVKEMTRRVLLPWYHALSFLETYAHVDGWDAHQHRQSSDHHLDRWILSRVHSLSKHVKTYMESYQLYQVVPALFDFIDVLTNSYIRLNRDRFWGEGLHEDKCQAYTTLYEVLHTLSLVMAPFAPFLSEYTYQSLQTFSSQEGGAEMSVHLQSWPKNQETSESLEQSVANMLSVILLGRQIRQQKKIKVKTPLAKMTIIHKNPDVLKSLKDFEAIMMSELNVKAIAFDDHEASYVKRHAKPNLPKLGKRLGPKLKTIKQAILALEDEALCRYQKEGSLTLEGERLSDDDLLIQCEPLPESDAMTDGHISLEMDTQLTEALIHEGMAREVINRIQKGRKACAFEVSDRIHIQYACDPVLMQIIQSHHQVIQEETLALSLKLEDEVKDATLENIEGHDFYFHLKKEPCD